MSVIAGDGSGFDEAAPNDGFENKRSFPALLVSRSPVPRGSVVSPPGCSCAAGILPAPRRDDIRKRRHPLKQRQAWRICHDCRALIVGLGSCAAVVTTVNIASRLPQKARVGAEDLVASALGKHEWIMFCEHLQVNAPMSHAGPIPPSFMMIGPSSWSARQQHHLRPNWTPHWPAPMTWVAGCQGLAPAQAHVRYLTRTDATARWCRRQLPLALRHLLHRQAPNPFSVAHQPLLVLK
ncbi:hypothetical protein B0T16DRAFT_223877 [Cercophora newfieldiana]|uniref:Uncharacterized protein n=1 Tax=Cercophora newfieldiana TaxID=92897 RepID=A0AA39XYS0_9PEZI|nr:hypothetical protein B0T16DRAFT_223877 [Cercophora newfieldiana]